MSKKYNFSFSINQQVYIKILKINGVVVGIFINSGECITYNVRYFSGLDMKETYFYADELSEENNGEKLGFIK